MMTDERLGPKAREIFARLECHDPEDGSLFPVILREHMEERRIESVEDLYRLYVDAGGAMDLEEFYHETSGEGEYLRRDFMRPLLRVFGLQDRDSVSPLIMSYTLPTWTPPEKREP